MSDRGCARFRFTAKRTYSCAGSRYSSGFTTATVAYDRLPRLHGETRYTLAKMVALAINGITTLSVRPIRMIALMGIILFVIFLSMSV